ncbi:16S rRNA (cytidine(1402)-2'-O)-methyltransferase [Hoeflea prorocentri]|uniref:Ribosomal RNA small subunit methyltransferase I n=1 Tax=Hoeflea prorocentri TaxID=1922333 RepID=A0A9X3UPX9_9HYPH|nr:16S rRNA (cytidine(1402)-2'-O)-methyltransferase [Hoeflea prorocentri]MCY6383046.1 16S rRNA (cytidine(1402)-2'-O)-methyltransferase [Hoeflea prorocentri]MDA5400846.1 16S rRNA (cytidine(1402)-2'-O)-methyltransferase [Hoeflea prorocentri]
MHGSFQIGAHSLQAPAVEPGLYLVATPIGNLADITLRALQVLAKADVLACEDTRVTRTLLNRYAIATKPVAYHEHNADRAGPKLIAALKEGKSVALVSDAGTPLISDPGFRLVGDALDADLPVIPIPGASAPLAALVGSGLPTDSFFFAGFLPAKDKARRERFERLRDVSATLVLFESPRRLAASLETASSVLGGERPASVCRELTKAFEEIRRGTLADLSGHYRSADTVKGEIVLVIGPPPAQATSEEEAEALLRELIRTHSPAQAASEAARRTGLPRKTLYRRLLEIKDEAD